jgi:tRNA A-37 threonylcarbamoyl transferase component Bud32
MSSKIIARGAEAILKREENVLIKERAGKGYRLVELDEKLRKQRTRKEAKLLEKAARLISVPQIKKVNEQTMEIEMQFIRGKKLSDNLDNMSNAIEVCKKIGENIAKLHDADIIHGDLTTSNMIYIEKDNKSNGKLVNLNNNFNKGRVDNDKLVKVGDNKGFRVYFIDFGLGFESKKIEDKAVDLHLIKQALEAKHFLHFEEFFKAILEGYKCSKNCKETLKRLEKVEKRGRYKGAY